MYNHNNIRDRMILPTASVEMCSRQPWIKSQVYDRLLIIIIMVYLNGFFEYLFSILYLIYLHTD